MTSENLSCFCCLRVEESVSLLRIAHLVEREIVDHLDMELKEAGITIKMHNGCLWITDKEINGLCLRMFAHSLAWMYRQAAIDAK